MAAMKEFDGPAMDEPIVFDRLIESNFRITSSQEAERGSRTVEVWAWLPIGS